jgi:ribosome modulation factor
MAYQRGKQAYKIGLPLTSCPYVADQFYQAGWERGWAEAQRTDQRSMRKTVRDIQSIRGK